MPMIENEGRKSSPRLKPLDPLGLIRVFMTRPMRRIRSLHKFVSRKRDRVRQKAYAREYIMHMTTNERSWLLFSTATGVLGPTARYATKGAWQGWVGWPGEERKSMSISFGNFVSIVAEMEGMKPDVLAEELHKVLEAGKEVKDSDRIVYEMSWPEFEDALKKVLKKSYMQVIESLPKGKKVIYSPRLFILVSTS